ncbi:hypothetical protein VTK73DRAFT_7505 [Phialemonium thermophilum]|uniref:Uncharacterized protein n=1 Tax=Phialemonium thermophilum TaxID=223376 RepID=A0ABR3WE20_9PEZI
MSWMDSWSRPANHQATPAPFYLIPRPEPTPYCRSCGRVISARKSEASKGTSTFAIYCSARCRTNKLGQLDREIERVFVRYLNGEESLPAKKRLAKIGGDLRVVVPCDVVEARIFGHGLDGDKGPKRKERAAQAAAADRETRQLRDPGIDLDKEGDAHVSADIPDYDAIARMAVRSGTRSRPAQSGEAKARPTGGVGEGDVDTLSTQQGGPGVTKCKDWSWVTPEVFTVGEASGAVWVPPEPLVLPARGRAPAGGGFDEGVDAQKLTPLFYPATAVPVRMAGVATMTLLGLTGGASRRHSIRVVGVKRRCRGGRSRAIGVTRKRNAAERQQSAPEIASSHRVSPVLFRLRYLERQTRGPILPASPVRTLHQNATVSRNFWALNKIMTSTVGANCRRAELGDRYSYSGI